MTSKRKWKVRDVTGRFALGIGGAGIDELTRVQQRGTWKDSLSHVHIYNPTSLPHQKVNHHTTELIDSRLTSPPQQVPAL